MKKIIPMLLILVSVFSMFSGSVFAAGGGGCEFTYELTGSSIIFNLPLNDTNATDKFTLLGFNISLEVKDENKTYSIIYKLDKPLTPTKKQSVVLPLFEGKEGTPAVYYLLLWKYTNRSDQDIILDKEKEKNVKITPIMTVRTKGKLKGQLNSDGSYKDNNGKNKAGVYDTYTGISKAVKWTKSTLDKLKKCYPFEN